VKVQHEARVGSLVQISIPNGLKLVGGRAVPEYKEVRAKVKMVFPTHLVCVVGKRYGHPYVAEAYKLIKW
jgi:hypothetical protein